MYGMVKAVVEEQIRRIESGRKDWRIVMRPDHGHVIAECSMAGEKELTMAVLYVQVSESMGIIPLASPTPSTFRPLRR